MAKLTKNPIWGRVLAAHWHGEGAASARSSPQMSGSRSSVLHDEGVGAEFKAVVRRLGIPDDIGVDLLPKHLEGHPRLRQLLEHPIVKVETIFAMRPHARICGGCRSQLPYEDSIKYWNHCFINYVLLV